MKTTHTLQALFALSEAYSRLEARYRSGALSRDRYEELRNAYRWRGEAIVARASAEDRREFAKKAP